MRARAGTSIRTSGRGAAADEGDRTGGSSGPRRTNAADGLAHGRMLRAECPFEDLLHPVRTTGRPDPVSLLREQDSGRVPELVPLRYGRMLGSPFAFFRGAARIMAADLSAGVRTPLTVQLCGDAHMANFGFFGSPERRLVFDVNDFDETLPGPFEFDLKRLAASLAVAG